MDRVGAPLSGEVVLPCSMTQGNPCVLPSNERFKAPHLSGRFTFAAVLDGQVWKVVFWRRMLGRTWVRIGTRTWDAKVGEFDLHVANLVSKSLHDRDQGVELLSRGVKLLLDVPKACVEHAGTLVWELGGWRALWGTRGLGQG